MPGASKNCTCTMSASDSLIRDVHAAGPLVDLELVAGHGRSSDAQVGDVNTARRPARR